MMKWIPCELHTHTGNSDGCLDVGSLSVKAAQAGLECIALTDHNTVSGWLEIPDAMKKAGIQILRGMEWTTFHGHMIALGIREYVDWRDKSTFDIQRGIDQIHEAGGLAGVAHPYRLGSPVCTGCCWQFETDWSNVDYLEVWSETFPPLNPANKRAYDLWTCLLNRGCRITAVCGSDWHGNEYKNGCYAVTYLGLENDNNVICEKDFIHAVKSGRSSVSLGPLLTISARSCTNGREYLSGDEMDTASAESNLEVHVNLDFSVRERQWRLDPNPLMIHIASNIGIIGRWTAPCGSASVSGVFETAGLKWIRAEMFGEIEGRNTMIAFTNAIYLGEARRRGAYLCRDFR